MERFNRQGQTEVSNYSGALIWFGLIIGIGVSVWIFAAHIGGIVTG